MLAALWSIETDISPSGIGWSDLMDVLGAKYEYGRNLGHVVGVYVGGL